ncbi:hypothetical protein [Providencia sp. PROV174]|nr:hypothetical protein [Providencia sp. PROV174]
MHLQEIVRTAPVAWLSTGNDPFLILRISAENCECIRDDYEILLS